MNIDSLLQKEGHFSTYFTGDDLDIHRLKEEVSSLFAGELFGLSLRPHELSLGIKTTITHEAGIDRADWFRRLRVFAEDKGLSYAIYPDVEAPPVFRLAVMDMDSTLINQEVIEELAEYAGVRDHVKKVTDLAMEGKLNFHEALRERVKLLEGQPASILEEVLSSKITASGGLKEMMAGYKQRGIRTLVVSGGFLEIVGKFAEHHGIDNALANRLEVVNGKLTGQVVGEIVDAQVKQRELLATCAEIGCKPHEAIAIGDGANDLKMMEVAGLGVGFCAKDIVREKTLASINRRRLDDVLAFME